MQRMSIHWKIMLFIFFTILFSLLIVGNVLIGNFLNMKESELEQRALITARTVAQLPQVITNVNADPDSRGSINPVVERIRIINNAEYIVVMDMNHIRLSHPIENMVGKQSSGTDEGPAFAEHTYTSKAKGEIGTAIRAFVPIMNEHHQQIGVVIAAYVLPGIWEVIIGLKTEIYINLVISLLLGIWGSWVLARHIKKQMFHLEPHEIARLLVERTETFNAMHEGVVAIDTDKNITIFNSRAKEMLAISGDVIGRKIIDVLPDTHLPEMLSLDTPIYNKELKIRNLSIVSNRIQIKVKGEKVGAVAIFQDRTEVKKLAEELTGVKAFVSALRVQNHEHMNKLHTIAGLLQIGNTEKALDFVFDVTEKHQALTRFLSKTIKDDSISGLLLSKVSRGKELGINVNIDPRSRLTAFPPHLDHHDFVVIIGNLIENAFDSLTELDKTDKEIIISIEQDYEVCSILVEDNGIGMDQVTVTKIFEQGFSTKQAEGRGIGLYLIKQIVNKGKGKIEVDSHKNKGTSFIITFYME